MTRNVPPQTEPEFLAADALPLRSSNATAPALRLDWKRALQMHPVLAAVTAALVFLAFVGYGLIIQPKYQAEAIFSVAPSVAPLLPQGYASNVDGQLLDSSMQQQVETFQRADTVQAAVRTLPVGGPWRKPNESLAESTERMQRALAVSRVGTSLQIAADLNAPTAKDAAQALSAISAQFLKTVHSEEDGRAGERVDLLKAEAVRLDSDLQADRAASAQLAGQLGESRPLDSPRTPADVTADQLRQELADLEHARAFTQAGVTSQSERSGDENGNVTTVSGLISTLNARKAAIAGQIAGMTPKNPIYQQDIAELRTIDTELSAALERSDAEQLRRQQRLRNRNVQGMTDQEQQLRGQIASQNGGMTAVAAKLQRYSELSHEIERLQLRLGVVRDAISTTLLQSNAPSRVNMVVAPTQPGQPKSAKRRLAFLAALPLALFAGFLAAILAHRQDSRVFLSTDLEHALGIKPMAVLPLQSEVSDALVEQGLLRMAGSIETAYLNNRSKTFVFTAPTPGVEVEELVSRIQGKLRELGYSALWLGAETLLRAEQDFEQVYGRGPSATDELQPSHAQTAPEGVAIQRLNWLKRDYDIVLIDAPPLLHSAMAEYAVRRTDATILVSESGITTREQLEAASGLLEQLGAQGIGAVLQDLPMSFAAPGYKKVLRQAEDQAGRPVRRDPVDAAGTWQVLHPGTPDELHIPGDPNVPRSLSRLRAQRTRTGWAEQTQPHTERPRNWSEDADQLVHNAAYTAHQD